MLEPPKADLLTRLERKDEMDDQQAKAAYLAGIIDGEGCLDFQKSTYKNGSVYYQPRIRITMVGDEFLEELKELVRELQLPFWVEPRKRTFKNPKWRDAWSINITGMKRVSPWISTLTPYLKLKLPQLDTLRLYIESRKQTNPDNGYSKDKGYTEHELSLVQKIKELKCS